MSGNGVVMMQKFIEANGLTNSESPAIFVEVHKALEKRLKRIEKIKELYSEDGDEAPMTKCPHCGSPSLIVRNCEFCGYAMLEGEASDEVTIEEPVKKETEVRTSRRGSNQKAIPEDNEPEIKETLVETKPEVAKEAPAKAKRELIIPTTEEINKARRPGLSKIAKKHKINLTSDIDKDDLAVIRKEMLSILLGEDEQTAEPAKEEVKTRTKVATKKEDAPANNAVDFSKAPSQEQLEAMTEDQLIGVIVDFKLPIADTKTALEGEIDGDDEFFACVDEILASLKSEEANQKTAEPAKEEVKTRATRTSRTEAPAKEVKEEVKVELVKISIDDLPETSALEAMSEKKLAEIINKFGLDLKEELKTLATGKLADDAFFAVVDAIDAKIEAIANDINEGKEPTYPATLEVKENKTTRTKKPQASEPVLEDGNETNEDYDDIDLDNADINYDDINIEDIADQA